MTRLLQWLLGSDASHSDKRRAIAYAIREEMDAHPVAREDFVRCRHLPRAREPRQRAAPRAYMRELSR